MRLWAKYRDLLESFSEDERGVCSACGERACVSLPQVPAHFCFVCDAVTIAGIRIDVNREIRL